MTGPARSAFYFSFYVLLMGATLLLFADRLLPAFGFAGPDFLWARLLGATAMATGFYYLQAGRTNNVAFVSWSVYGRAWVVLCMLGLVAIGAARPVLALFTLGDIAGLAWSWLELRRRPGP